MPTTTATRRPRTSRPVTAKDGAEASGVIAANARARKASSNPAEPTTRPETHTGASKAEAIASDAALPKPVAARRTARGRTLPPAKTGNPATDKASATLAQVAAGLTPDERTIVANDEPQPKALDKVAHQFLLMPSGQFEVHKMGCRDIPKAVRGSQYDAALSAKWATEEEAIRDLWSDQIAESVGTDATLEQLAGASYVHTVDFMPCTNLVPLAGLTTDGIAPAKAPASPNRDVKAAVQRGRTVANGKGATTATRTSAPTSRAKPERRTATPKAATQPRQAATSTPTTGKGAKAESEAQAAKRTAKRTLARNVLLSIEGMLSGLTVAELAGLGMSRDEARKVAAQWVHHLPVRDTTEADSWWPKTMPKPDRSDWR
jgi:hypothetical protein